MSKKTKPKLNINWNEVYKLLEAGCSGTEIAAFLGISKMTLYSRSRVDLKRDFSEVKQEYRRRGDSLLRAKQYQMAMAGDKTMMIFLGKNRLNQADKIEQKVKGDFTTQTKVVMPEPDVSDLPDAADIILGGNDIE